MLPDTILKKHAVPFQWGVSDCVTMAADMIEYLTGMRPSVPAYSTEREALLVRSFKPLSEAVIESLGPVQHATTAEYGDIVLTAFAEYGEMLGVADPPVFWIKTDRGIMALDMTLASGVFKCQARSSRS